MSVIEFISTFSYFRKYDDLSGKILDFGSNSGNLITSSNGQIKQCNYAGLDISVDAISAGRSKYPEASWQSYNRFHPCYNPEGDDSVPVITSTFDKVFSYSVFSHFCLEEILVTLKHLRPHVSGDMFFSYCSTLNRTGIEWFRNRRVNCDDIDSTADMVYLVNNKVSPIVPSKCEHFVSFFNPKFLVAALQDAGYDAVSHESHGGWRQDCLQITPRPMDSDLSLRNSMGRFESYTGYQS